MARVPHVVVPPPRDGELILLPEATHHHLTRVLRLGSGASVSYTDGAGLIGQGTLDARHVVRGEERTEPRPSPSLTMAVAPPRQAVRARWVVEKLAELGVDRLRWLDTVHGEGRPPPDAKARGWAEAALEQSRGAHLLDLGGPVGWSDLDGPVLVATPGAGPLRPLTGPATLAIGPEAGFAAGEVPAKSIAFGLGGRILRVETAAAVAAALALAALGRL